MEHWIITGVSRGLGKALAQELIAQGKKVYSLGRSEPVLPGLAGHEHGDFRQPRELSTATQRLCLLVKEKALEEDSVFLVNNAGVLGPLASYNEQDFHLTEEVIQVNLLAPMAMTAQWRKLFSHWKGDLSILNISSGAARHPYPGWSAYCTSKAALDMWSLSLAEDEKFRGSKVKVYALAPGVIETGMQEKIRNEGSSFPWHKKFLQYKEEDLSWSPKECALRILKAIDNKTLPSGVLSDLRKLSD